MKKVQYEGPASVVQVMVDGEPQPHEKGTIKEYPDEVALELVENSKENSDREIFKAVKWSPKKLRKELYPPEPEELEEPGEDETEEPGEDETGEPPSDVEP